eukprot:TRINITY_DN5057_c0_g1_i8.p2 TRINITY_DN5057_c0_g1~~TRINITY_DN5057_c0_g1_i8.p2  ORF type:complete len:162 (+),score=0.51 TRINITY_DN5057_c0_g1_i8:51-536(+)
MSQCLGDIRNHQMGIEQEFRTFMSNVQTEILAINSNMQQFQDFFTNNLETLKNQFSQIQQEKKHSTDQTLEDFQKQQWQLSNQLERLRFDLNDKENQINNNQQNYSVVVSQQIQNQGARYPNEDSPALGAVIFKENSQRLPLLTDRIPLGKAFTDGCCIDR